MRDELTDIRKRFPEAQEKLDLVGSFQVLSGICYDMGNAQIPATR